jgi:hypothetical protein
MLIKFRSVGVIERIVAPIGMLFGVLLIYSGVFNLLRTNAFYFNGIYTVAFSYFYVGIFMCMIGFVIASLSYLIFHGKITLRRKSLEIKISM